VFFRLLEALMGSDNVAYRNWTDLSSSTGRLGIIDKSLVLCNDIDNIYMKEMQALKTLVACEPQTVKQLYRDEFTATFTGKIISSGNDIPRVNDSSNAWNRRIIIIPFKGDFRANPDPTLADKLTSEEAVQALIVNAVIRVDRVLKEGFSPCKAAERELREYNIENNPILQLLYENKVLLKGRLNAKRLDFIYSMLYLVFCRENGFKPVSKLSFAKRAKKAGLLSVNTGAERLYYLP
jgi:putative DNA primase/helicase